MGMECWGSCWFKNLGGAGRKECSKCKNQCDAWFQHDAAVQCACRNQCLTGNTPTSREDFLNTMGLGSDMQSQIDNRNLMSWTQDKAKIQYFLKVFATGIAAIAVIMIVIYLIKKHGKK